MARLTLKPAKLAIMVIELGAFAALMISGVRPFLKKWTSRSAYHGNLSLGGLASLLIMVWLAALLTSVIGIFAIFGAFLFGALLYDQHDFRRAVQIGCVISLPRSFSRLSSPTPDCVPTSGR